MDRYEEAATCRDASLMYLTNGECHQKNLSGFPRINWKCSKFPKAVESFKQEVISYNAAENIFLARDGYLERMGRQPRNEHTLKPHEEISFGVLASEASEQHDGPIIVGMEEWAGTLHFRKSNILLSAPAGYGKSHVIKNVLRSALERQYGKRLVWITASIGLTALAFDGVTIHGAAGLKRGTGLAQDLVNEIKSSIRNWWRHVKANCH